MSSRTTLILSKIYDLFDMVYGYYVEYCTNNAYITIYNGWE
nr:MAG TPA: hypothetical protein [Caudoviricetes sp.]